MSCTTSTMNGIKYSSDVASQLLNSSDSRVAAAARRVFSNAIIIDECCSKPKDDEHVNPNIPYYDNIQNNDANINISAKHNGNIAKQCTDLTEDSIPFDIKEAASAVAMLAPGKCAFVTKPKIMTAIVRNTNTFSILDNVVKGHFPILSSSPSPSTVNSSENVKAVTPYSTQESSSIHSKNSRSESPLSERKRTMSPDERLKRSRERNKMHARKTRQRKKEQMKTLEQQVEALKARQIELKRLIEEKNTANILVDLFTKRDGEGSSCLDPKVDELLKRDTEDIPDSSKIPELPALILPGNPSMRKVSKNHAVVDYPDDGIDYELLAKDRATCSQAELDMIRRERNRMHAKRTRDRKRIFIEKMEVILRQLESENKLLEDHLESILDSTSSSSTPRGEGTSCDVSPALGSSQPPATNVVPTMELLGKVCETDIATFLSREKRKAHSSLPTPVALEDMDCTTSSSSVSTDNCDESAMGRSLGFPNQFEHENKRRCIAS